MAWVYILNDNTIYEGYDYEGNDDEVNMYLPERWIISYLLNGIEDIYDITLIYLSSFPP